ncbi:MAG: histidine phosphatase family protein [Oscillospiraceae bacterium]|nr:histidine phosphatase family protein [Oscillospiraceae bacterium]
MRNYKIHFIRHGLTQANLEGRYIGRTDEPLCAQGIAQIKHLMEECDYPKVSKVYTSPLMRCVQTAEMLYPNTQIKEVAELLEMDMGKFEGKTAEELKDNPDFLKWLENAVDNPPPNGEGMEDFLIRLVGALNEIILDMMENEIFDAAIVTHGGAIMALLAAVALPKMPMNEWQCAGGAGYTAITSAQMWQRDRTLEVVGYVPDGIQRLIANK